MTKRILRISLPVDDQWHDAQGGRIVHVDRAVRVNRVDVWFEEDSDQECPTRKLRVFGTGQPLPDETTTHVGTAVVDVHGDRLVWHVRELGRIAPSITVTLLPGEPADPVAVGREVKAALRAYEAHGGRADS